MQRALHECVSDSRFLGTLTVDELDRISPHFTLQSFHEGSILCKSGDKATFFGIVLYGSLKAAIPRSERWPGTASGDKQLEQQEWRRMERGDVVGEMSLFSGIVRTSSVIAISDGKVVFKWDLSR